MLKRTVALLAMLALAVGMLLQPVSSRAAGMSGAAPSANAVTLAVFGDWPYSPALLGAAPTLIDSINGDPKVRLVLHLGDIHSGSMPCTGAGLVPLPAGANPGWNQTIDTLFQQFKDPLVYTPGDNEWSDCHKAKELRSGAPLNELAAVRSLFFSTPGQLLGGRPMQVVSQAQAFDPSYPRDAQFVENVRWAESQVVFATLNLPGSYNDTVPWTGGFSNPAAQQQEVAERTAADLRWLDAAFATANANDAKAVVIGVQADMWDPEALALGGDGLSAYQPIVQRLADLSAAFGRPVLLLNGDSHLFEVDTPLADPASATGSVFHEQAVPNLTRITVQGSTNTPSEWLRLTIDPKTATVFSWENVAYLP